MNRKPFNLGLGGISQQRELPTVYRRVVNIEWFRKFPFWDRVKILFGGTALVVIRIPCQWDPGKYQPVVAMLLCDSIDQERAVLEHKEKIAEMDKVLIDPIPKK